MPFLTPVRGSYEFTQTIQFLISSHAVKGYRLTRDELYPDNQYGDFRKVIGFTQALDKLESMGMLIRVKEGYRLTEHGEQWLWGGDEY